MIKVKVHRTTCRFTQLENTAFEAPLHTTGKKISLMFSVCSLKESISQYKRNFFPQTVFSWSKFSRVLSASEQPLGFIFLYSCTYSITSKVRISNTQFPQNSDTYSDFRPEHLLDFQYPQLHLKMTNFDTIGKYHYSQSNRLTVLRLSRLLPGHKGASFCQGNCGRLRFLNQQAKWKAKPMSTILHLNTGFPESERTSLPTL